MYASWLDVLSSEISARTFTQSQASFGDSNRSQGWCLKVRSVVNIEDPNPYWFVYAWRFFWCLLAVGTLWTVVDPCDFPCSFRFNLSGIRDVNTAAKVQEAAQWFSHDFPIIGWFFSASASTKIIHNDTKPRGGMESHTTPLSREGSHL